jgi:NAD(P)-dependent dehydrogenase (short-subunit alcohol dehydrogenase family)
MERRLASGLDMAGRLKGKVALITGAARGIGRASVERFVAEGARVLAADIDDEAGRALARAQGESVRYEHADVASEAEVQKAVQACVAAFGRLDCLFNNAGFGAPRGALETLDLAEYDRMMAVLLRGVFAGFKHAIPVMRAQGGGVILSTASIAGLEAGFGPHVYSAAKAGVIQLTRTAAQELGPYNIRVNCLCPGGIATAIFGASHGLSAAEAEQSASALRTLFKKLQPIPRAGLPEDVAAAAAFLASDDASFISGHALVIDGALTAGARGRSGHGPFEDLLARFMDPARRGGA